MKLPRFYCPRDEEDCPYEDELKLVSISLRPNPYDNKTFFECEGICPTCFTSVKLQGNLKS